MTEPRPIPQPAAFRDHTLTTLQADARRARARIHQIAAILHTTERRERDRHAVAADARAADTDIAWLALNLPYLADIAEAHTHTPDTTGHTRRVAADGTPGHNPLTTGDQRARDTVALAARELRAVAAIDHWAGALTGADRGRRIAQLRNKLRAVAVDMRTQREAVERCYAAPGADDGLRGTLLQAAEWAAVKANVERHRGLGDQYMAVPVEPQPEGPAFRGGKSSKRRKGRR